MRLVEQWRLIRAELPAEWADAQLAVAIPGEEGRRRAAALLGPAGPGRAGEELRVSVHRGGGGIGPDQLHRLLARIDRARVGGTLRLVEAREAAAREEKRSASLADDWAAALAPLPPDWSDLHCELQLTSSDLVDRAALLLAPANPTRVPGRSALRLRVARRFGYGVSPEMAGRCLARLDAAGIPGRISILRALSDTDNVDTQGPVWRVAGKAV